MICDRGDRLFISVKMSDIEACMFKYVVIARDEVPLVNYPLDLPDIHEKTLKILKKLDTSSPFSVIEQNNFLYTASTDSNKIVFLCVCDKNVETRQVGKFLTTLKQQWTQNYGAISLTIAPGEKSDEFCPKIKEMYDSYNEKLRPSLVRAEREQHEMMEEPIVNINDPLLNNKEDSSLASIPNPFASQMYGDQESMVGSIPERFDEIEPNQNVYGFLFFFRRYRFLIMLVIGVLLLVYFAFAFYCEDFNLFKCSSNESEQ
ncbi:hypothetical protein TRFO_06194 [Tritrichomonas foetus]|uniref:Longin domain-containing protein n=1 Tax=Tritrichomonas foetus TaxID=1144522 RepID=A0A1J4K1B9_9EUKA|nr:hypothetical protein TRFO_06194 [Tritrichomonas foetus]|eukprot:OHT04754.1 hypothetical protein TRFO_06194 [Tritrichomonas foetus]